MISLKTKCWQYLSELVEGKNNSLSSFNFNNFSKKLEKMSPFRIIQSKLEKISWGQFYSRMIKKTSCIICQVEVVESFIVNH
jgi:hypothetical protein